VFENRVLKRIPKPKTYEGTGDRGKVHNEELHNLYCLPNIIKMNKSNRLRWVGYESCMREIRGSQKILVQQPEGKRLPGKPLCRWEDNNKMDLKQNGRVHIGFIWLRKGWWQAPVNTATELFIP
jgi:hypothetical protein